MAMFLRWVRAGDERLKALGPRFLDVPDASQFQEKFPAG